MATEQVEISWKYDPNIVSVKVEYKKKSDDSWTTPTDPINPTSDNKYRITVDTETYYDVQLTTKYNCNCTPLPQKFSFYVNPQTTTTTTTTTTSTTTTTTSTSTTTTTTTIYVPPVQEEFDNLASPTTLIYNSNNGMMYFTDYDADHNLQVFDPSTAQSTTDISSVDPDNIGSLHLSAAVFSKSQNKIYTHGDNSGGMLIIDCDTNTLSSTITYGDDIYPHRQRMYLIDDTVYAVDTSQSGLITVDTTTDTRGDNFIPDVSGGYVNNELIDAGNKIWVIQIRSLQARAISYLKTDLTQVVDTINDISTTNGPVNTSPYLGFTYYDVTSKEIWVCSAGDKAIKVINTQSGEITHSIPVDTQGKDFCVLHAMYYEKDHSLYFTGSLVDSSTDPGIPVTCLIDTASHSIVGYQNVGYSPPLVFSDLTNFTYGAIRGKLYRSNPNTGYKIDGKIVVYG